MLLWFLDLGGLRLKQETRREPPTVMETCIHCGHVGPVGRDLLPYSFALRDKRWLCHIGLRDCLAKAWEKHREHQA